MKIEYHKGDIFESPIKVIIHGCNDRGVFGSGFVIPLKNKYPESYQQYRKEFESNGLVGGSIIPAMSKDKIIINMITQNFYGRDGKRYAKYDWIAEGFYHTNIFLKKLGINEAAMPAIGSGLGGGDFAVIAAIIESESKDFQPHMYIL